MVGSRRNAVAMFVSGPIGTSVTVPASCPRTVSTIRSAADRADRSRQSVPGSTGPSSPVAPWMSGAVRRGRRNGCAAPPAMGTFTMRHTVATARALAVTRSNVWLPATVVTASRSMSGLPCASIMAIASSWPGSQSRMILRGTDDLLRMINQSRAGFDIAIGWGAPVRAARKWGSAQGAPRPATATAGRSVRRAIRWLASIGDEASGVDRKRSGRGLGPGALAQVYPAFRGRPFRPVHRDIPPVRRGRGRAERVPAKRCEPSGQCVRFRRAGRSTAVSSLPCTTSPSPDVPGASPPAYAVGRPRGRRRPRRSTRCCTRPNRSRPFPAIGRASARPLRHRLCTSYRLRAGHLLGADAIGMVDVGCSAGLNLTVDRVGITYDNGQSLGDKLSPSNCAGIDRRRPAPFPWTLADTSRSWHRIGIDRDPIDVTDPDDVRWLHACLSPPDLTGPERRRHGSTPRLRWRRRTHRRCSAVILSNSSTMRSP